MQLQSLDNNRPYKVTAIGLDCINDNIAEVQVEDLAETFNLNGSHLHRGSGSVDVLVGIDHARLHQGETRQQGSMVARHSPIGWVVFWRYSKAGIHARYSLECPVGRSSGLKRFLDDGSNGSLP